MQKENQLVKVIEESGLDKTKGQILLDNFSNYFEIAAKWEQTAAALVITDVSQTAEMKMAREGRLFLKEKRVAVEKTRKTLKDSSLREGQTIDAIAKILTNLILPIEESLEDKEKFVEIQAAKQRAELKAAREIELSPFAEFVPAGLDLGTMTGENYAIILSGAKLQLQQKHDAEAKAEADRIERERIEAEEKERQRIEAENLRMQLKAERERVEAREKQLTDEREKADAILRDEKQKAAKIQADANAKMLADQKEAHRLQSEKDAENHRLLAQIREKEAAAEKAKRDGQARIDADLKAKLQAERKAKRAPDKAKLLELAGQIDNLNLPVMKTEEGQAILKKVTDQIYVITSYIHTETDLM